MDGKQKKRNVLNCKVVIVGILVLGVLCVAAASTIIAGKVIGKKSIRLWAADIYGVDSAGIVVTDNGMEIQKSWGISFRVINRYECRHEGKGIPLEMIWAYYPWGKMYGLNFSTGSE